MDRIAAGEFCWVELATPNRTKALAFYSELFRWNAVEQAVGLSGYAFAYSVVRLVDRLVGSVYELMAEQRERGIGPHWMPYLAVESADGAVRKAEALGATSLVDPVDLLQAGRVAILEDPAGARFAVWQARNLLGFQVRDEPGSPCWFELSTPDGERAIEFYRALFGWTGGRAAQGASTVLARGDRPVAGVTTLAAGEDGSPRWTIHFGVADRAASCRAIEQAGGRVGAASQGPSGTTAVTDPQGASFTITER